MNRSVVKDGAVDNFEVRMPSALQRQSRLFIGLIK
jgi:hypothetical protein